MARQRHQQKPAKPSSSPGKADTDDAGNKGSLPVDKQRSLKLKKLQSRSNPGGSSQESSAKQQQQRRRLLTTVAVGSAGAIGITVAVALFLAHGGDRDNSEGHAAVLASAGAPLAARVVRHFACSRAYADELQRLAPACLPAACGRLVDDSLASPAEAAELLALARRGLALGGGSGGASILDLHSGALSYGEKFVSVYALEAGSGGFEPTTAERRLFAGIVDRIRAAMAAAFGVPDASALRLTRPTFFSRLTAAEARTPHDEYWHAHVDKETYGSFHYTSLLYLADHGVDFTGGRFAFVTNGTGGGSRQQRTSVFVEPRAGRVSAFTSGAENTHLVERVASGERFALTIAFTCDAAAAIDPAVMGPGGGHR